MANRLASATSPYLLQHAQNPVDWWEWSPEAFEEARRRNVPILLSIGYAACHWCHVMAHESFEDQTTADYLNEHYVSIKVDREERPDVDAIYMQATTAMTGHGGWPMTCVLDHDGNPFFAGTYFPERPRRGQPSFTQVLQGLTDAWVNRGHDVARVAGNLREHLQSQASFDPGEIDLDAAVQTLAKEYDAMHGGFGGAPKFPPSMVLEFLRRSGETEMLTGTLDAMARGGLHDQLGGGFARYAVDTDWVVPHFEKMLYDNALLLRVYAATRTHLGAPLFKVAAEGVAAFLLRELRTVEGGFASALDADSEGVEGRFYVWTPAQLVDVLGADDGRWAAALLEVTDIGTFEHGSSTLQLPRDPDDPERWFDVQTRLLAARDERVRPARDDKVVAAWNGLAISGLVELHHWLGEQVHLDAAVAAGDLLARVHVVEGRLRRVSRDGVVGVPAGVLEDYGCVAAGFLDLVQATGDPVWLERAGLLIDVALEHFRADDGGFFDTADDAEQLVARPRDPSDNASPSGLSALLHSLVTYAALTGSHRHRTAAEEALASVAVLAQRVPRFAGWSLAAAVAMADGPEEIAVIGRPGAERAALAAAARRRPNAVVVVAEPGTTGIALVEGRGEVPSTGSGQVTRPAAYVCRNHVCGLPVTDAGDL